MAEPLNSQEQVEYSIQAAEKMVGEATMSMDPDQLQAAEDAVSNAKEQLAASKSQTEVMGEAFFEMSEEKLAKIEHQLNEARD